MNPIVAQKYVHAPSAVFVISQTKHFDLRLKIERDKNLELYLPQPSQMDAYLLYKGYESALTENLYFFD